jgi:poly(3-hydroxybutyrate) depolymerase
MKTHHLQAKVGHYGIFNGSRFRADIVPAIGAFTRLHDLRGSGPLKRALKQMWGARPIEIPPEPVVNTSQFAIIAGRRTLARASGKPVALSRGSRRTG